MGEGASHSSIFIFFFKYLNENKFLIISMVVLNANIDNTIIEAIITNKVPIQPIFVSKNSEM